jgi:hypothetical protein
VQDRPVSEGYEPPPAGRRPSRSPGRRPWVIILVWVVAIAVVFIVGLAVGMAIEDAPAPGGEQTIVRTLVPATVGPPRTVTETVDEP